MGKCHQVDITTKVEAEKGKDEKIAYFNLKQQGGFNNKPLTRLANTLQKLRRSLQINDVVKICTRINTNLINSLSKLNIFRFFCYTSKCHEVDLYFLFFHLSTLIFSVLFFIVINFWENIIFI